MKAYLVTWTIEVEALDEIDAALEAYRIQSDDDSVASVFRVKDLETGKEDTVDLEYDLGADYE